MCAHGKGGLGINGGRRRTERERIVDSGRLCASGWEFFEVERDADGESMRRSGEQERRGAERVGVGREGAGLGLGSDGRVSVCRCCVSCEGARGACAQIGDSENTNIGTREVPMTTTRETNLPS